MINKAEFGGSPERMCGNCTACCFTHGIPEIHKDPNRWCVECKQGKGCKIYATRPPGCVDFSCQWKKGILHLNDRPDKSGIVVDYNEFIIDGKTLTVGMLFEAEMQKGKRASPKFWKQTIALFRSLNVSILVLPIKGEPIVYVEDSKINDLRLIGRVFQMDDGRAVNIAPLSVLEKKIEHPFT
jgi:hypothetical protein